MPNHHPQLHIFKKYDMESKFIFKYIYINTYIKQYQFLKSGHKVDRELGWVYERIWGEEREGGKFIIKI